MRIEDNLEIEETLESEILFHLPNQPYSWGKMDCFTLASWVREYHNLKPFPDMGEVYTFYNYKTFNSHALVQLLEKHCVRKDNLEDFDLILLRCAGVLNLGTYYESGAIFMNTFPTWRSIKHFASLIDSIWRY